MFVYNNVFQNENEIREFVIRAEEHYKKQVLDIADDIAEQDMSRLWT